MSKYEIASGPLSDHLVDMSKLCCMAIRDPQRALADARKIDTDECTKTTLELLTLLIRSLELGLEVDTTKQTQKIVHNIRAYCCDKALELRID